MLVGKCGGFRIYLHGVYYFTQVVSVGFVFTYCHLSLVGYFCAGWGDLVLLERRVVGYVHFHKGPNRIDFVGLFQPFKDAIRVFLRNIIFLWFQVFVILLFSCFGVMSLFVGSNFGSLS
jgi:NADH:ubiquinone oxidoreductase subunit H